MKNTIFVTFLLLITTSVNAFELFCMVKLNLDKVISTRVEVPVNSSVPYGKIPGFSFKVKNLGYDKFEIDVFNGRADSRSYAEGLLRGADDELRWTLWSRSVLLETSCSK